MLLWEIKRFREEHPEFRPQLEVYEAILRAQEPLVRDPRRGMLIDLNEAIPESLQKKALDENKPISFLLDPNICDFDLIRLTLLAIVDGLMKLEIEELVFPMGFVEQANEVLPEIVQRALQRDNRYFELKGEELGIRPTLFLMLADALIQPSMMGIASRVNKGGFLDVWGRVPCPICGKIPSVVLKREEETWRFICDFCDAEYAMNIFKCPYCGSEDFQKIGFLMLKGREAFEVGYCMECNCYFKIINQKRLRERIPMGLRDLYTYFLDEIAEQRGLRCLDDLLKPSVPDPASRAS